MSTEEIEGVLHAIFHRVLARDNIRLRREDTAHDVVGWDSLNHVQILMALEKHYAIRFRSREIGQLRNVGDLIDLIGSKLAEKA